MIDWGTRNLPECFLDLTVRCHPEPNEGYSCIFGKLIGVTPRYVSLYVAIVEKFSLPRRTYYDTFQIFLSFPKFMETNRVSKSISRTNTLLFLQESENKVIVSPCHKWHRFFQPLILASKFWGWRSNNKASIRCLLSWKIAL